MNKEQMQVVAELYAENDKLETQNKLLDKKLHELHERMPSLKDDVNIQPKKKGDERMMNNKEMSTIEAFAYIAGLMRKSYLISGLSTFVFIILFNTYTKSKRHKMKI